MADEREQTHNPITGRGLHGTDPEGKRANGRSPTEFNPLNRPSLPADEANYWRVVYLDEPYFIETRTFGDYLPAYELGWAGFAAYGKDVDIADTLLANDWDLQKRNSALSWDEARPATRASWRRAENARTYLTDGSASYEKKVETLNHLLENARDGALGFREAAEHAQSASLKHLLRRRADSCTQAASELHEQLHQVGGRVDEGGTLAGAAHRVWTHIRGLFGGGSDETMLTECERGEDAAVARYRDALQQNLPPDLHALVLRQFEVVQRNHDRIKGMRDRARAESKRESDEVNF